MTSHGLKPIVITLADFTALFGVRRTKAFALIKSGRLQPVRIGRRTYITMESAEALIADAIRDAAASADVERE